MNVRTGGKRRDFLRVAASGALLAPLGGSAASARGAGYESKNERPGLALIGAGGQGKGDAMGASHFGDFVAVCDVDKRHAEIAKEHTRIGKGKADVVVTEGFSGNIALKAAEGTARQVASYIRDALSRSWLARLGFFIASGALRRLRAAMDTRRSNGGVFLGLNGIVIKSHGGTDAEGFAAAIEIGYSIAQSRILEEINADLVTYRQNEAVHGEAKTGAM